MSPRIFASLLAVAAALPLAAQAGPSSDRMEADVLRAVIQQHAGTSPSVVLRSIEDAELCWGEFAATTCLPDSLRTKYASAVANYRARNPKSATWSDPVLALTGAQVSDTLARACGGPMHFAFSRVGFDTVHGLAIVRYTVTTGLGGGSVCGTREAGTYLLQRGTGATWSVVKRVAGTSAP